MDAFTWHSLPKRLWSMGQCGNSVLASGALNLTAKLQPPKWSMVQCGSQVKGLEQSHRMIAMSKHQFMKGDHADTILPLPPPEPHQCSPTHRRHADTCTADVSVSERKVHPQRTTNNQAIMLHDFSSTSAYGRKACAAGGYCNNGIHLYGIGTIALTIDAHTTVNETRVWVKIADFVNLDRRKIAINLDIFPVVWFERNARVITSPVQTDIIYKALKSVQMFSAVDWSLRAGEHLVFSYRLYRMAEFVQGPQLALSRLYPKRYFSSAAFFVTCAVVMSVFVEKKDMDVSFGVPTSSRLGIGGKRYSEHSVGMEFSSDFTGLAQLGARQKRRKSRDENLRTSNSEFTSSRTLAHELNSAALSIVA
ncbi:hypothetical protein ON010_g1968 [Phytophthora cinnamomi]|nr:hypothetical protein ON010_g1968 [Phytophthora cinnamomi]